jgi:hypothetical protein
MATRSICLMGYVPVSGVVDLTVLFPATRAASRLDARFSKQASSVGMSTCLHRATWRPHKGEGCCMLRDKPKHEPETRRQTGVAELPLFSFQ